MANAGRPAGLGSDEAKRRLALHGPNELGDREHQGWVRTLRGIATEPMFLLLLVAAALYLVLGDLGEGLLLGAFALLTVGLVVFQERRSQHALDALRALAAPQARVVRDGVVQRVAARELVPGDLLVLGEGERVAADALLREAAGLALDESLLTGESAAVRKRGSDAPAAAELPPPGGDDRAEVYAGTLVVAGHGLAEVVATGRRTQAGRIGASLAALESAPTPLQLELRRLVRVFGIAALAACTLLALWYGLRGGAWSEGLLAAIALGMAMLPEEFPMALAVFLALGAWRLARIQVLARRPAVIEALGAASVLCVDKTGTLTENRMCVRRLVTDAADDAADDATDDPTGHATDSATGGATDTIDIEPQPGQPLPEPVHRLLEYALLASRRGSLDPMERALFELGDTALADTEHQHPQWQLAQEFPPSPAMPAMSQLWDDADGAQRLATKGAPEAVFALCRLAPERLARLSAKVRALAADGLRVLAVAEAAGRGNGGARAPQDHELRLLGLVAFADPLRASVPAAVAQARGAGIAVAMITGDHAATALAIARQAGIEVDAGALAGADIARLDDAALAAAVRRVRVFARVTPEQKLRLVQAFARNGETVAMTGDGVNDAPALKAAHIGIAMGVRGTDVAREAAGLVLLDEDFGRIVGGVRMGRRIHDNLRKVMTYIAAIHVPIAGLALLPVLWGLPPLLLPAHVVLTEMVIDPVCSLAFEGAPEDPRLMQRPPRAAAASLVGWPMLWRSLVQGGLLLAATLAVYVVALRGARAEDAARTLAVLALTAGNLLLVALDLSAGLGWRMLFTPAARAFWAVAGAATGFLALALALPALRGLLHFAAPAPTDLALALLAVVAATALATGLAAPGRREAVARLS